MDLRFLIGCIWTREGRRSVRLFPRWFSVCRYDPLEIAGAGELDTAIARHSSGWSEHLVHVHRLGRDHLCLAGEIDASNDRVLTAVFTAATRSADAELIVDCADLAFVSVSGWRAILTATAEFRERGGRIRLSALRAMTARVLHLTGFAEAFELESSS